MGDVPLRKCGVRHISARTSRGKGTETPVATLMIMRRTTEQCSKRGLGKPPPKDFSGGICI
eukprot:3529947-Pyramimonas_sp.AAC.1